MERTDQNGVADIFGATSYFELERKYFNRGCVLHVELSVGLLKTLSN
jgi:hypothetical protein